MFEIVRFYAPYTGMDDFVVCVYETLEEAQAHCKNPNSRLEGVYFEGYREV